jgi:hypothetical protein
MVSHFLQYISLGSHLSRRLRESFLNIVHSVTRKSVKNLASFKGPVNQLKLAVSRGRGIMHDVGAIKS